MNNETQKNIVDTAVAAGNFKTLAAALGAAGLVNTVKGPGPFTVFAPTDAAFAKLPAGTVENRLKPENKDQLTHREPSRVFVEEERQDGALRSLVCACGRGGIERSPIRRVLISHEEVHATCGQAARRVNARRGAAFMKWP